MAAHPLLALGRRARRLALDERGVAFIEYAFTFPILLLLGLGGLECANLALAHLRVSQIGMAVADNAGRVTTRIDESDINEVFAGAKQIGEAIDFEANGRIVLSSLQDNGQGGNKSGQMINWQRCFGKLAVAPLYGTEDKGRNDSSLPGMGPAARRIQSLPNTAVMFVEITYNYQPLIPGQFIPKQTIRYESAFNVRERTEQNITNTKALPENDC
jgi:hypothetical protein